MITELEFKSLSQQGFNRIPLIAEAFADLETPLSLYLKLAYASGGGKHSFLLESVVGGERFGRYSFIGLPARTWLRASGFRTEVVTDGDVVEAHEGNPLDFIAAYQKRFKVALRPGLPRFCGGLAGYFGYDAVRYIEPKLAADLEGRRHRHARHPAAAVRGTGGHRQPVGPAVPDRLRRPDRARGVLQGQAPARRIERQAALQRHRAGGQARPLARGGARVRQGRLPRSGAEGQGLHRRRRHDAGAGRPAPAQALHRSAAEPVPRAAFAEPVAVHVLLRHGRVPDRRRVARDPGAPGTHRRRRQGDDPPARRHAAARRDARAGQGARSRTAR